MDKRNTLISEMPRLVHEPKPKSVMIENVPGILHMGKAYFEEFLGVLLDLGYKCNFDILEVANYGLPQRRRRFVLLAGKGFDIPIPPATHSNHPQSNLPCWNTVR